MPAGTATKKPAQTAEQKAQLAAVLEREGNEAKKEVSKAKGKAQYYIRAPLADASENDKAMQPKTVLLVHPGPTTHPDTGEEVRREAGEVVLWEGEGYTDDPLAAAYLKEQWPQLTIKKIDSFGRASNFDMQKLEKLRRQAGYAQQQPETEPELTEEELEELE